VLAGPILAVQAQKWLEIRREERGRKLQIFKTLMATRATALNPLHIEALNLIDVEFSTKKKSDRSVINAWKVYLDHLANSNRKEQNAAAWVEQSHQLLTR